MGGQGGCSGLDIGSGGHRIRRGKGIQHAFCISYEFSEDCD